MPASSSRAPKHCDFTPPNNGWFFHEEDQLGSIEPGKLGDVVVLSDDFLDPAKVPDEQIKRIRSVLTVVGGDIVHDDL